MSPRRRVAAVSAVLALATVPYAAQAVEGAAPMTTDGGAARAYCGAEDGSAWVWRSCGDHKRGIITLAGRRMVVGPVRFDRLNRAFRVDWERTPRLRGDGHRFDVQAY